MVNCGKKQLAVGFGVIFARTQLLKHFAIWRGQGVILEVAF